jgi:uncharacterized membrane protein HdeD (DUF308 family)
MTYMWVTALTQSDGSRDFVSDRWTVRAFLERPINSLWWLGLISGILMTVLAFWTAGQFWIDNAYLLLVFAGIWALMEGIVDVVRAFEIREDPQAGRTAVQGVLAGRASDYTGAA